MRSPEETRQKLSEAVLRVRSGQATSRRSLADCMHLSPTTAGFYVDHLIASGHLRESGLEQGRMGRPKRMLTTCAEAGWFAGVEFNAGRIHVVRVAFSGVIDRHESALLAEGADVCHVMDRIATLVSSLAGRDAGGPLLGLGVGAPGLVDPERGLGLDYTFIPGWKDVPIQRQLSSAFEVPVTLENNLRTIALAERWFGDGREMDDYVILGPRSGFGIAIMTGGRLLRGRHHGAGEVGRWPWPAQGQGYGEVHDAMTAPAVWRRLSGAAPRAALPADLRQALVELLPSTRSTPAWEHVIHDYARVIGQLHLILDSEAYFLHGPLTGLGQPFCHAIAEEITTQITALKSMPPSIRPSSLGDEAGALGAASLAMEAWSPA